MFPILGAPSLGTLCSCIYGSLSVCWKAEATAVQDAVSSCPCPIFPGKGLPVVRRPSLPLGLKMEKVHLTLGPPCQLTTSHPQRTLPRPMWPLPLFWETFFTFFFFFSYWKMSLWGSECQLVYIKIVNCLKNILWWIHETARKGSLPGLQLSALYTDEWPPGRGEGIPPDLEVCCTDANTAQSCGMTLSLMLVGERG